MTRRIQRLLFQRRRAMDDNETATWKRLEWCRMKRKKDGADAERVCCAGHTSAQISVE